MKVICVPRSLEAMKRLDVDACYPDDLDELNLTQEQFELLMKVGFFDAINSKFDLLIEDYEDEVILKDLIPQAKELVREFGGNEIIPFDLFKAVEHLFILAERNNTGVFFFF